MTYTQAFNPRRGRFASIIPPLRGIVGAMPSPHPCTQRLRCGTRQTPKCTLWNQIKEPIRRTNCVIALEDISRDSCLLFQRRGSLGSVPAARCCPDRPGYIVGVLSNVMQNVSEIEMSESCFGFPIFQKSSVMTFICGPLPYIASSESP